MVTKCHDNRQPPSIPRLGRRCPAMLQHLVLADHWLATCMTTLQGRIPQTHYLAVQEDVSTASARRDEERIRRLVNSSDASAGDGPGRVFSRSTSRTDAFCVPVHLPGPLGTDRRPIPQRPACSRCCTLDGLEIHTKNADATTVIHDGHQAGDELVECRDQGLHRTIGQGGLELSSAHGKWMRHGVPSRDITAGMRYL